MDGVSDGELEFERFENKISYTKDNEYLGSIDDIIWGKGFSTGLCKWFD